MEGIDAQQPCEKCQRTLRLEQLGLSSLEENRMVYHGSPCGRRVNLPSCDFRTRSDLEERLVPITTDPDRAILRRVKWQSQMA